MTQSQMLHPVALESQGMVISLEMDTMWAWCNLLSSHSYWNRKAQFSYKNSVAAALGRPRQSRLRVSIVIAMYGISAVPFLSLVTNSCTIPACTNFVGRFLLGFHKYHKQKKFHQRCWFMRSMALPTTAGSCHPTCRSKACLGLNKSSKALVYRKKYLQHTQNKS